MAATPTYRVLTGPTAAGKTDWLLRRAETRPLRVISADSRQVYRGMDIGTGRPTAEELTRLPHYCIDLINPGEVFSAHQFLLATADAFNSLQEFEGEVWVCGGTGLYIRALAEQLSLGPPPRPLLRMALQPLIRVCGPVAVAAALGLRLREDANPVRVLRAAERAAAGERGAAIYAQLGLGNDAHEAENNVTDPEYTGARAVLADWLCAAIFVLDPGTELEQRITRRTAAMFEGGLIDEARRLNEAGYGWTAVVAKGIGYREAAEMLDGGLDVYEAVKQTTLRTRQYAKRQRTYFRGMGWPGYTGAELELAVAGAAPLVRD